LAIAVAFYEETPVVEEVKVDLPVEDVKEIPVI